MTQIRLYQRPAIALAGIFIIAMSLRAPITGIAPIIGLIQQDMQLGASAAGLLIALPLLAFAAGSLIVPSVAQRVGMERSVFAAMILLACGVLVRSTGTAASLFVGTAMVGIGISFGNVLLPSILKRDFSRHAAVLTTGYVLALNIASSVASAVAVPIARASASGWQLTSLAFVLLPVLGIMAWAPQLQRPQDHLQRVATSTQCVWRSALAWHVTFYFGINSFVFYACVAWLPAILHDAGYSAQSAGALHGLLQLTSTIPAAVLGPLMRRLPNQRGLGSLSALLSLAGFIGLAVWPAWGDVWVTMLGVGMGAGVMLGLAFLTLRTTEPRYAAALASMAQFVGYILAAAGPVLVGQVHEATGGWQAALLLCAALTVVMAVFGLGAGRSGYVDRGSACSAVHG
jgi:CP family cyanate transporter-like MFS transporter